MFKVHGFLDGKKVINWRMWHIPLVGGTMRFSGECYVEVKEVIRWYGKAKADIVEIKRSIDDEHVRAARIAYTVEHLKEGSLPQWHAAGYLKEASKAEEEAYRGLIEASAGTPL